MNLSPLVQAAMNGSLDTEKLKELLTIQKEYEANEARKAYYKALSEFKKNPVVVIKDRINSQYSTREKTARYVSKDNLVNTVNAELSKHGLSARFDIEQPDGKIKVTCILSHSLGHSEQTSMAAAPDNSGAKNPLQQIKSTVTYLQIATYEAITGTASQEGSLDDDGNGADIPGAPEGYDNWEANLIAAADEGLSKLEEAFKGGSKEFRVYITKNKPSDWADLKKKAAKNG